MSASITPFALTDFRGTQMRFGIKDRDRFGHMYVPARPVRGNPPLVGRPPATPDPWSGSVKGRGQPSFDFLYMIVLFFYIQKRMSHENFGRY